ncbi:exo-alpha-sialidase [Streptomyces sp. NPDC096205]|uniref:exo-alpha-sialidase n=1 Tax=Streptomyces sp. NPDC096205 TaxID=3366081 RepID=UPI0038006BB7
MGVRSGALRMRLRPWLWCGLLLALLAMGAACMRGEDGGQDRGGGERATAGGAAHGGEGRGAEADGRIPSATDLPGRPHSIGFAADGSGFTLLAECDESRCRQHVAVLDAGARRWHRAVSPLPDVTGDEGISAGLEVLGTGRALINEGAERLDLPARTWFTRDAGRTWTRGTTWPTGSTASVPVGAPLLTECLKLRTDGNECARNRLLTVLPDTGEHRVLRARPPLKGLLSPAGDVADNALFVAGEDPRSGLPSLALSQDRGRTWQPTHLTDAAAGAWPPTVVAGPSALYAIQGGQLPDREGVKNGLVAIHRSGDGGHTWVRVWSYRAGVQPLSVLGDPVAADDHSLTVYGEKGVWRSTDGARTFRPTDVRGIAGSVRRTPLGWLWTDSYGNGAQRISADGIHWHGFELGQE